MDMREHMGRLATRIRVRRRELGLRQQDVADLADEFAGPDATIDVYFIGLLERGQRAVMITPEEVAALEHALRWPAGTILGICGYTTPRATTTAPTSRDVIATLMDAEDLTDTDKRIVRDTVQSMARRAERDEHDE